MKNIVQGVGWLFLCGWLSFAVAAEHPAQELAVTTTQKIIAKIKEDYQKRKAEFLKRDMLKQEQIQEELGDCA